MDEKETSTQTSKEASVNTDAGVSVPPQVGEGTSSERRPRARRPRRAEGERRGRRGGGKREERRVEYDHKIVSIRRVARVVAGGRRFNFSVSLIAGNRRGMVGVGMGKAGDTSLAIDKAMRSAKKHMVRLPLTKEACLPHEVHAKYGASVVTIVPARGRGLVAGSSVRTVLELAGVKDVMAKIHSRSKNQLNNARAAMKALATLRG
jgi:small subunit ribosomal protein S5